ncbi:hypothetical protein GCM10022207_16260 [Streptomyces lannensis]|uniref:Uncharacterized protein n=1 Tax=Streptomyces lannensis TaxID=766498 RepID=A0ABP7JTJ3_9ACTN
MGDRGALAGDAVIVGGAGPRRKAPAAAFPHPLPVAYGHAPVTLSGAAALRGKARAPGRGRIVRRGSVDQGEWAP